VEKETEFIATYRIESYTCIFAIITSAFLSFQHFSLSLSNVI